jgi:mercuric ion transport protein
MSITNQERAQAAGESGDHRKGWFAAGGLAGAVLASSCCIGPLALLSLGVSGAWIGNLTALEPLKPAFVAIALLLIGLGFRQVYFRPHTICEPGSVCARPRSAHLTKTALWSATVLVLAAITIDWWAPLFY